MYYFRCKASSSTRRAALLLPRVSASGPGAGARCGIPFVWERGLYNRGDAVRQRSTNAWKVTANAVGKSAVGKSL